MLRIRACLARPKRSRGGPRRWQPEAGSGLSDALNYGEIADSPGWAELARKRRLGVRFRISGPRASSARVDPETSGDISMSQFCNSPFPTGRLKPRPVVCHYQSNFLCCLLENTRIGSGKVIARSFSDFHERPMFQKLLKLPSSLFINGKIRSRIIFSEHTFCSIPL